MVKISCASARPLVSFSSVDTVESSNFFSLPSSCPRFASFQIAGSSARRLTSISRSFFVSKSKIPPQLSRAGVHVGKLVGNKV
jgi:hypothetical protein